MFINVQLPSQFTNRSLPTTTTKKKNRSQKRSTRDGKKERENLFNHSLTEKKKEMIGAFVIHS